MYKLDEKLTYFSLFLLMCTLMKEAQSKHFDKLAFPTCINEIFYSTKLKMPRSYKNFLHEDGSRQKAQTVKTGIRILFKIEGRKMNRSVPSLVLVFC